MQIFLYDFFDFSKYYDFQSRFNYKEIVTSRGLSIRKLLPRFAFEIENDIIIRLHDYVPAKKLSWFEMRSEKS